MGSKEIVLCLFFIHLCSSTFLAADSLPLQEGLSKGHRNPGARARAKNTDGSTSEYDNNVKHVSKIGGAHGGFSGGHGSVSSGGHGSVSGSRGSAGNAGNGNGGTSSGDARGHGNYIPIYAAGAATRNHQSDRHKSGTCNCSHIGVSTLIATTLASFIHLYMAFIS